MDLNYIKIYTKEAALEVYNNKNATLNDIADKVKIELIKCCYTCVCYRGIRFYCKTKKIHSVKDTPACSKYLPHHKWTDKIMEIMGDYKNIKTNI